MNRERLIMTTPIDQMQMDRQIRVFISSTFLDMKTDRDHLVKFVFPELRKLCESRGVVWGEVDLRWGVTDEQAARRQSAAHLPGRNQTLPALISSACWANVTAGSPNQFPPTCSNKSRG